MSSVVPLRFHHLGLAARDPERAAAFVRLSGYEVGPSIFDPLQRVNLRWCVREGQPAVEIVSPADADGPLAGVLASNPSSFYHLCYETEGASDDTVVAMRAQGMRTVTVVPPTPAVLFGGRRVSFHVVHGFGLIELLEPERCRSAVGGISR